MVRVASAQALATLTKMAATLSLTKVAAVAAAAMKKPAAQVVQASSYYAAHILKARLQLMLKLMLSPRFLLRRIQALNYRPVSLILMLIV